jgi:pyrroline-5-carboxylate reductase
MTEHITFIGGGNMASAIIGGLLKQGLHVDQLSVVEPFEPTRQTLLSQFGLRALPVADATLSKATLVVWAVKPQTFRDAAAAVRPHASGALHLSVAAGIRSDSIARWLGTERIVRSMPNTPALVGKGMTALFARAAVSTLERQAVEQVIATTGQYLWVEQEANLDAVTALSGSGPAYVFFFIEAMIEAGVGMGLSRDQAHRLAVGTFVGASELARTAEDPPEVLRQRVTSKGGTTYAAITSMEADGMKDHFIKAIQAAELRARELGDEFGKG